MPYPGGKNGAGVYQAIINRMPPHRVYIEPFLGGGAIMRLKRPAAVNIGMDLDAQVIQDFRPPSPDLTIWTVSPAAAVPAIGSTAGHGGGRPRELTAISGDGRRRASSALASGSAPAGLAGFSDAGAPRFHFQHGNAIEFLAGYPWAGGELVYCDPPYMHETRGRKDLYRHEMTNAQHQQLLAAIRQLPCLVMISGYWTALYMDRLAGWHSWSFQAVNRAGQRTTEWIWQNFAEPVALHDYRYLGQNFRERERIKRKTARWIARLAAMPLLERRALLAALETVPLEVAMPAASAGFGDVRSRPVGQG